MASTMCAPCLRVSVHAATDCGGLAITQAMGRKSGRMAGRATRMKWPPCLPVDAPSVASPTPVDAPEPLDTLKSAHASQSVMPPKPIHEPLNLSEKLRPFQCPTLVRQLEPTELHKPEQAVRIVRFGSRGRLTMP